MLVMIIQKFHIVSATSGSLYIYIICYLYIYIYIIFFFHFRWSKEIWPGDTNSWMVYIWKIPMNMDDLEVFLLPWIGNLQMWIYLLCNWYEMMVILWNWDEIGDEMISWNGINNKTSRKALNFAQLASPEDVNRQSTPQTSANSWLTLKLLHLNLTIYL